MSSPSFLAFADLHLGHKLYNLPELAEDLKDHFVAICNKAIELRVAYLVSVGDMFEDNWPKAALVSFVQEQVARLRANGVEMVAVAGDHDKPVDGESWRKVCGIPQVSSVPFFFGYDYFDYSLQPTALQERLEEVPEENRRLINWIFLHGQVASLYKFTVPKKNIDFTNIDIFKLVPNLKGVILGDIHATVEGRISDKDHDIFIGYCGSPGIIDASEITHNKSLIYFNGTLHRIPFEVGRIYLRYKSVHEVDVEALLCRFRGEKKAPVIIVDMEESTGAIQTKLRPLNEVAIVRPYYVKQGEQRDRKEPVNIRSELSTNERIDVVLESLTTDEKLRKLGHDVLVNDGDIEGILDHFKAEML